MAYVRGSTADHLPTLSQFTVVFALIELYTTFVLTLAAYPIALLNWPSIGSYSGSRAGANLAASFLVLCWTVGLIPLRRGMRRESRTLLWISLAIQTISYAGLFMAGALTLGLIRHVSRIAEKESDSEFIASSRAPD